MFIEFLLKILEKNIFPRLLSKIYHENQHKFIHYHYNESFNIFIWMLQWML